MFINSQELYYSSVEKCITYKFIYNLKYKSSLLNDSLFLFKEIENNLKLLTYMRLVKFILVNNNKLKEKTIDSNHPSVFQSIIFYILKYPIF